METKFVVAGSRPNRDHTVLGAVFLGIVALMAIFSVSVMVLQALG